MINVIPMSGNEHVSLFEACLVRDSSPVNAFKEYRSLMDMRRLLNQANDDEAVARDHLAESLENLQIEVVANRAKCPHDLEILDRTQGIIRCRVCGVAVGDLE